jgi:hypothetical protein
MVVGLGSAVETSTRGSRSGWGSELRDSAQGVDDFAVEAVEHPLLQRHRRHRQASGARSSSRQWWVGRILFNKAYIYTRDDAEADHDHSAPVVSGVLHQLRRGTKYSAAHYLRSIIANDDRPRTMHVEAQQTDRALLPDTIGRLLDRHGQRLIARAEAWRQHASAARGFRAAGERMMSAADQTADRSRAIDVVGLEL